MQAQKRETPHDSELSIADVLSTAVEHIRSAMAAGGAIIAVRDWEGLRCVASAGHAPSVGSQLLKDSELTRECLETGAVVLCEDAENDPRVRSQNVQVLHLRSAVIVPIQVRGSIVGVIELFSSRTSAFNGTHIAPLQGIAGLLAPVLTSVSVQASQPVANKLTVIPVQPETSLSVEELPADEEVIIPKPQDARLSVVHRALVYLRPALAPVSAPISAIVQWFAQRTIAVQTCFAGAVTILFLIILFAFTGSGFRERKTSLDAALPPSSHEATRAPANPHPVETKSQDALASQRSTTSDESPRTVVPPSPAQGSSPELETAKFGASSPSVLSAVSVERDKASASSPLSQPPQRNATAMREDSKPFVATNISKAVGAPASPKPSVEVARLDPAVPPTESFNTAELALTPAVSPMIKSMRASRPDFVLDRTLKGHSGWVTGVAFSSDGQRLASGSWDQTVKFWDVPSGHELNLVGSKVKEVQALAFSRDGHWLATENSSDTVTLWDGKTGKPIRTLPTDKPLGAFGSNWVYSIAFSPDGRFLASGVDNKTVRIWDVSTGKVVRDLVGSRRSIIYAAFSPDGRLLATGDDDKGIEIWDVSSGQEIQKLTGHKKPVYAVAFSPDGRWLASASADKSIKLWDIAAGREVFTLAGHANLVTSLAFSPDGRWLASGSWDKTVRIWDVATGHAVQTLGGHDHSIYSVAFDSRGRWLASGSEDGTISLWRLSTDGEQVRSQ